MAATLVLIYLEKIGGGFMSGIGGCLVAPIKQQFKYLCGFNSHITELETKLRDLGATRQVVQMGADEIHRQAWDVRPDIEAWLKSVNEVTTEVKGIIQDMEKVEEGCLNGWCSNLKLRYSLSMQAVTKTKILIDLRDVGVQYTQTLPSYSSPLPGLETITNRDFIRFESRRLNMEEIIKALKHDEINLIGICGMAGVGKTTLVKEVAKIAKEDNHFHEVAMAVVSQKPNLTDVQACIAEMLGLKNLHDTKSPIVRADLLRRKLLQDNKKVLVILDDIWAEFDLQAMGIPLEGANKNFKLLYTSRTRDLWHDLRTKKEIPVEILSKDEAWQLFREKAGDSADAPDLRPTAKQIVDECGCLPLALVLIGSALSKKSGRNYIKEIWKGMLDRLTCAGSTPADKDLSSRLALSYEYLEDEQAKCLFLLCCLFREDEDIRIEDLARYGLGLSLFDGIHEMEKVRRQVFLIVDELKSCYLLLDSEKEKEECVKVHDIVRDIGISIVSKDKSALVIHEEVSEWPKDTYEHYSSISLISRKITELPKGLACPNLEFLLLDCKELKELPCQFFEGMGKLKVLVLKNFEGILALPSSLRNLHTLSLPFFNGKLENVSEFGGLFNLNTLSFRDSPMEELPEEIGELGKLRLLDLTAIALKRIPPSVISRLVHLEELYVLSKFKDWEGEGKEEEGRNANLRELELLSNLNTLEIGIRSDVLIPRVPIFSKLKIFKYKVKIFGDDDSDDDISDEELEDEVWNLFPKCERVLRVMIFGVYETSIPIPSNCGGIDSLLRSSDGLVLKGEGCNDLVQVLLLRDGVDGLQQLKVLRIRRCDTPECLANTMNLVHLSIVHAPAIFPILKVLHLHGLVNLREICRGPVPARSFEELTFIRIYNCGRLRNLFQLPVVGCLPQLKRLVISYCDMMEEVFWKEQQEDVHAATNRIEFPKLEVLKLVKLPSLMGLCRGIDQIDFPQLKELCLQDIPHVNLLFHNSCNLSFNSMPNDNFGFLSLFPEKVSLPNLEVLDIYELKNLERLGQRPLSVGSLSKLKIFSVCRCSELLCVIPSQFLPMLRELQELTVESCNSLEVVFELEGLDSKSNIPQLRELKVSSCEMLSRIVAEENGLGESSVDEVEFPQLESLELLDLPKLLSFFPNVNVNVNVNTTTLANSNDHLYNPMQPQPLFNEKVVIPSLEYMKLSGLQNVSDLWGSELPTISFSKLKDLQVTGCTSLRNIPCISWFGDLNNTTQGLQEVARLLYTDYGEVLALGSNGTMTMWNWPNWEVTTSALPLSGLAMANVIGVNLEEAVPCVANLIYGIHIISACGGAISLFEVRMTLDEYRDRMEKTWELRKRFMPPPPASTFLAFYPQDYNIIAIGMEDSTIRIYNHWEDEVIKSEMKGHKKHITGLSFSTDLNILVSSGADAQLCIWRIGTWEHLKSVSIQQPAGKACNGDTRVEFHYDEIRLLVSHETQLAIYDASEMDRIRQWVPQDVLPAPISFAVYSCDSQLVYTSFCDGNIGVFDADSLTLTCRIVPSIYLSPAILSGGQVVYPRVVAAHPRQPNQFAIGLTNGSVVLMEPQESEGKWGLSPSTVDNGMLNDRTASSSNSSYHTPDQNQRNEDVDEEVDLDVDKDKDEDEDEKDQEEEFWRIDWNTFQVMARASS